MKTIRKIANRIKEISTTALLFILLNSAYIADPQIEVLQSKVDYYQQEALCYKQESDVKTDEICEYQNFLSDPLVLAPLFLENDEAFRQLSEVSRGIPHTKLVFAPGKRVDMKLDSKLYAALLEYSTYSNTPVLTITSVFRKGSHSKHHYGLALDIRINKESADFLEWTKTPEGEAWLKKYNLRFLVEDNRMSKFLQTWRPSFRSSIFLNGNASGPHIHLEVQQIAD